mmetsp:Transcript_4718/g.11235  ORF Transcript_4718/g.11235 Transcript_4718/m.11235 type:complete len:191 (-) Transcript_4718:106-678(-)|eukprot:CAMPEP_0173422010 /NCGR_PEP_ID=MMETSP1357-20121228/2883_1 /TAXON_ID=77926 /ORGANISM="Hemiselmis rufescens, Strain PCC563" /LENGTH=190 /DNA_ID=CAMNT_0014384983 /DNA_START=73 /DNA_END=645 /DNA_ORIENTATION=-
MSTYGSQTATQQAVWATFANSKMPEPRPEAPSARAFEQEHQGGGVRALDGTAHASHGHPDCACAGRDMVCSGDGYCWHCGDALESVESMDFEAHAGSCQAPSAFQEECQAGAGRLRPANTPACCSPLESEAASSVRSAPPDLPSQSKSAAHDPTAVPTRKRARAAGEGVGPGAPRARPRTVTPLMFREGA